MEGYTDVCVYVWMGGWVDGNIDVWMDGCWMVGWMMDEWMLDGWMIDGWFMDEWKDRQVVIICPGTISLINYLYPSLYHSLLWGC